MAQKMGDNSVDNKVETAVHSNDLLKHTPP